MIFFGPTKTFAAVSIVICAVAASAGCKSYHVGNQYSYRSDIRSVHVGFLESDSYRRFIAQRMTEALVKEVELRTPLTIAEPATADSFLQGRIVRDTKQVVGETKTDEPRSIDYRWVIEVTWVDRAGNPLMQRQYLRMTEDAVLIPEGGQSLASSELKLMENLARQIVGQMETPW